MAAISQRVVITAAAQGIGRCIAERFLASGARVFICDIDGGALDATLGVVSQLRGRVADVADHASVARFIDAAAEELGGIDVLVNNAGIAGPRAAADMIEPAAWRATVQTNLDGAFYAARQCIPFMRRQGGGCIINISTCSTQTLPCDRAPYVASKSGLEGLTRTLARELGRDNIRCNAILPGLMDTPRARALVERVAQAESISVEQAEQQHFLKYISMRCWIDPAEVAELAIYLASPPGRHITGQLIAVSGGCEWEG